MDYFPVNIKEVYHRNLECQEKDGAQLDFTLELVLI